MQYDGGVWAVEINVWTKYGEQLKSLDVKSIDWEEIKLGDVGRLFLGALGCYGIRDMGKSHQKRSRRKGQGIKSQ